jgi:hypothetical protein
MINTADCKLKYALYRNNVISLVGAHYLSQMKKVSCIVLGIIALVTSHAQESQSPKPGITINGSLCLIQNTVWSCVPVDCDTVTIMQGDSIEFCTFQEIFLNTDTAYWMQWIFSGCDNYADTVFDNYPSTTPLCYNPRWDVSGIYNVTIRYNGWLSAYPSSDCYVQGPSQWNIAVNVLPDPNSVHESQLQHAVTVFPQPATHSISISGVTVNSVTVRNCDGAIVQSFGAVQEINVAGLSSGIYILELNTTNGETRYSKFVVGQ